MNRRLLTTFATAALSLVACSLPTEPIVATATAGGIRFSSSAPALATYDTTFMVVQGEKSEHFVNYAEGGASAGEVFLFLDVPHNATFVDAEGHELAVGAEVAMRVQIARDSVAFKFQPHGSTFKRPVKLRIDYAFTELAGMDPGQLKMWYQATDGMSWTQVPLEAELNETWLQINLKHFSNYAVAF